MQKLVEKLGFSESATSAILWVGLSLVLLVIVAALAFWLVRTLRPSLNMSGNGGRGGRPQRLAVTDAFPLDRDGRKLVIVRRDNTEHLLLIGGPNDLLVESNITRHDRSARGLGRNAGETDVEEASAAPVQAPPSMPAAPQPVSAPLRSDEFDRALAGQRPLVAPKPVMRPPLTPAVAPPVVAPPIAAPPVTAPPVAPAAPDPAPQQPEPARAMPPAPPVLTLESLLADPVPVAPAAPVAEPEAPVEAPAPVPTPPPRAPAMSEMARRLNEALQKPMSGTLRPPFNRSIPPAPPTAGVSATPMPPITPVVPMPPPAPPIATPVAAPPTPEPAVAALDSGAVAKADMDLLEEEMARLLGRPGQPKKPDAS